MVGYNCPHLKSPQISILSGNACPYLLLLWFGGYKMIIKAKSLTSEVPGTLQMATAASSCGAHHTSTQMKSRGSLYFSPSPQGTSMQWAPDTSSTEIHTKCFLCRNSHWSHIQGSFICCTFTQKMRFRVLYIHIGFKLTSSIPIENALKC